MRYLIALLIVATAFAGPRKSQLARAQERYHKAIATARKRYAKDLQQVKRAIMQKGGDIDEALRISELIKAIEGKPKNGEYASIISEHKNRPPIRTRTTYIFSDRGVKVGRRKWQYIEDPRGFILRNPDSAEVELWELNTTLTGYTVKRWTTIDAMKAGLLPGKWGMGVRTTK